MRKSICIALLIALSSPVASATEGEEFSLFWFSIDGGGGVSGGDVYSLSGAIGPAVVGETSGNDYTVQGGFWSIVALEVGAPPVLRISRTATGDVEISWPGPALGFVLQKSSELGPSATWTDVGASVITHGTNVSVIEPVEGGGRFYRLRHQNSPNQIQ